MAAAGVDRRGPELARRLRPNEQPGSSEEPSSELDGRAAGARRLSFGFSPRSSRVRPAHASVASGRKRRHLPPAGGDVGALSGAGRDDADEPAPRAPSVVEWSVALLPQVRVAGSGRQCAGAGPSSPAALAGWAGHGPRSSDCGSCPTRSPVAHGRRASARSVATERGSDRPSRRGWRKHRRPRARRWSSELGETERLYDLDHGPRRRGGERARCRSDRATPARRLPPRSSPRPGHRRPRTPASGAPPGTGTGALPRKGAGDRSPRPSPRSPGDRSRPRDGEERGQLHGSRGCRQECWPVALQRSRSPWRAALAGRRAGCGEPHDATDDSRGPRRTWPRRSEARRAIRVTSEKSARFFVASSASRARATSIGRTEARSPVGSQATTSPATPARSASGSAQSRISSITPANQRTVPENMGRRTWPWRARSTRDRRGRRPASATRGRCRGSRASAR